MAIDQYDPLLAWMYARQLGLGEPQYQGSQGWSTDQPSGMAQQDPAQGLMVAPPPAPPPMPAPAPEAPPMPEFGRGLPTELPPGPTAAPQGPPGMPNRADMLAGQPGMPMGFDRPSINPSVPRVPQTPRTEGPEPFDMRAREETFGRDRTSRRAMLEGMTDISEGLGGITGPFTAGSILHGQRGQRPQVAESLRTAAAGISDEIGPSERQMVKDRWGLDLPADAKWSRVREQLPEVSRALHGGMLSAYQRESLAARERKEQGIQSRFEAGGARRDRAQDFAEEKFQMVPDVDRRALQGKAFLARKARALSEQFDAVSAELGPIWGRWNVVARKLGLANPDAISTIADMSFMTSQFIYEMTGKQMNESEMYRLEKVLPQAWDSPEQFKAIIGSFLNTIAEKYDVEVDFLRRQGKDVSAFENFEDAGGVESTRGARETSTRLQDELQGPGGLGPEYSGWVMMRDPQSGEERPVHPDDVPAVERAGGVKVE